MLQGLHDGESMRRHVHPASQRTGVRMRRVRQTLWAGLIAGVVIACAEPAAEVMEEMMGAAGSGLKDAGMQLLIDAGMVTGGVAGSSVAGRGVAGRGVAGNVAATKDAATGMGSDAKAQEPTGDGLPRPHWVLRDKNATPVQAEVYQIGVNAIRFTEQVADCVIVGRAQMRDISLYYKPSTGKIPTGAEGCANYVSGSTWRDVAVFSDAQCNASAYGRSQSSTVKVGSTWYYTDGAATLHVATYYQWNADTSMCTVVTPTNGQDLWAFKPVPADIVNLLPNPPYTMELVY